MVSKNPPFPCAGKDGNECIGDNIKDDNCKGYYWLDQPTGSPRPCTRMDCINEMQSLPSVWYIDFKKKAHRKNDDDKTTTTACIGHVNCPNYMKHHHASDDLDENLGSPNDCIPSGSVVTDPSCGNYGSCPYAFD